MHEDPHWDWHTANLGRELRLADEKAASILNSWNPDLRSFRAHGGKLIEYHGWVMRRSHPEIPSPITNKCASFSPTIPTRAPQRASDRILLPALHGAGHAALRRGQGATKLWQRRHSEGVPDDADHDIVLALDRWVTQGVAPEQIIANGKIGADAKANVSVPI